MDSLREFYRSAHILPPNNSNSHEEEQNQKLKNALDAAHTILYCVDHQKRIVDDVLTLSKLDADLLEIMPIRVQPMKTIRQALKIFDRELKASDIRMSIQEDPSLQEFGIDWVMLDPNRFLQILINMYVFCNDSILVLPNILLLPLRSRAKMLQNHERNQIH
jgi:signal transduction histidine kinase